MYHVNRSLLTWSSPEETDLIIKAEAFAEKAHHGQLRDEGVPFITHLIAAADIVAAWGCDAVTIAATVLHDVVEDTPVTLGEVTDTFGEEVAYLVDGATKIVGETREESEKRTKAKMASYVQGDARLAYVKIADRIHNLSTIEHLSAERRERIITESKGFYRELATKAPTPKVLTDYEKILERF